MVHDGMTIETLRFLRDLVGRQQISADAPDIVELANLIWRVRSELDNAIKESE
jgi:hypothetical protein